LGWHHTGLSNAPTEAMNLLIKKIKRVGHAFHNFENYRLRRLLHCGVDGTLHPSHEPEAANHACSRRTHLTGCGQGAGSQRTGGVGHQSIRG
jgi:Transposase